MDRSVLSIFIVKLWAIFNNRSLILILLRIFLRYNVLKFLLAWYFLSLKYMTLVLRHYIYVVSTYRLVP